MENRGLFLTLKDVQLIENCSHSTSYRRVRTLKDIFEKKEHQRITIDEYIEYTGITREQFNKYTQPKNIHK